MDQFREEVVTRNTGRGMVAILGILVWVGIVIFGGIAAFALVPVLYEFNFDLPNLIVLGVSGFTAFMLWRNKDALHTEYEYTFTNDELDFAKVMGNKRRRHLLTLPLRSVEQGGRVDSDGYRRLSGGPGVKAHRLILNPGADLYYLYFTRDGVRTMVVFEPSEAMIALMRSANRNLTA